MNDTAHRTLESLSKLRLPELQARFAEIVGEPTRSTQRQLLDVHALILGRGASGAGEHRRVEVAIGNQHHKPLHPLKRQELSAEP
ncbi:hypothetical protein [Myxococcus qinghaiensis]|uniref:hypothetical protein n=1 Tax=Myxococcus qinghaiensis TaxID=2906758 RepID=UPI0020A72F15|nr:hypothetical protein [Myxococcus qinghaiensis]MCP3164551.1 hypothetical protein [Myxococcus qinghaiensis]